VDAVLENVERARARPSGVADRLGLARGEYLLATIHRPYNTDDPVVLRRVVEALEAIGAPVILPVHPRTRARLEALEGLSLRQVRLVDPVGYLDMLGLLEGSRRVLTDSGGVQKEAYVLGVPCVTLRPETEWVETVEAGWNVL